MHVAYQIIADGTDVTDNFQDLLTSLNIIDEAGQKSDTAEIMVDDRDYLVALPETGTKLKIALGFKGALVEIGTYVVDDMSGEIAPDTMTISSKAANMLGGIRARKTRSWREMTVEDIVGKIAGEHGLKPQVSDSLKAYFLRLSCPGLGERSQLPDPAGQGPRCRLQARRRIPSLHQARRRQGGGWF